MYTPTFTNVFRVVWSTDEQAHGPIVFAISLWLLAKGFMPMLSPEPVADAGSRWGWGLLFFGGLFYVVGRSQEVLILDVGSVIWVLAAVVLIFRGVDGLKKVWFPLFFMLFMIPLPGPFVDAVTMPMKMAVSYAAESIMYALGFPIARSGVILQIGQYQLLVADTCAGLHTLFTLEALGLLYLNIIKHQSALRNVLLAVLIVPISFSANVVRVIVLTLITYFFGDEAGQGFLHGFAGMVLFLSALLLIIAVDGILRVLVHRYSQSRFPESANAS